MKIAAPGLDYSLAFGRTRSLPFRSSPMLIMALLFLIVIIAASALAPLFAQHDPAAIAPSQRLQPPSATHLLGTDSYGRDLFARIIYGGQVSLLIGFGAALAATACGLFLGLVAGYFRRLDGIVMRAMDGVMAIPNVLLAIAVVTLWGGHLASVLFAIVIPEIPRVTRLVRSITLSAREESYVKAAIALGSSGPSIVWRHLMPSAVGPLLVVATYICASAILLESILSFLGAGVNPEIPTWGNIMAEGRLHFQITPSMILWPALLLSLTILAINITADAVRDRLDPRSTFA